MGLFNFIYKLTIIFSNKKKMKVFIILAIIIILIFAWSRGVFASEATDSDALTNYQLQFQNSALSYIEYLKNSNKVDSSTFDTFLARLSRFNIYVTTTVSDNAQFLVYLYLNNVDANSSYNDVNDFTLNGSWFLGVLPDGTISGTEFPCKLAQFQGYCYRVNRYDVNGLETIEPAVWTSFYLPAPCYMVRSVKVAEFLTEYNAFNELPTTYNTSDEELQAITSSGLSNINNSINQQTNTMTNSINSASSSISNTINSGVASVTNTLTDDSVSVTSEDLPTDNTTDPTSTGLNSIFTMIQTAFTGTPTAVSFPIPFTNQTFTIEPGFTENSMRKGGLATMVNVIHLYWYYRIYSFIFLKYVELLEHIKEGEFEETMGNIKKEVL